ncbi:FeoA family protein [Olivibacter sitiensis]|uniref:FeoA family protein n=1 Tax=Olivibacter sitiensis TaxID=376470 RepID=UPI0004037CED|nr:FeoA family protein [Olivibacter sitiensis]
MNLTDLKIGQKGKIRDFADHELSIKLMEMGCLPGEIVSFDRVAPLGDPIAISISGYQLCLRKEEAAVILIERQP